MIYLSTQKSINQWINQSINPSIYLSMYLSMYLSVCLPVCLSIYLSFFLSIQFYQITYINMHLYIHIYHIYIYHIYIYIIYIYHIYINIYKYKYIYMYITCLSFCAIKNLLSYLHLGIPVSHPLTNRARQRTGTLPCRRSNWTSRQLHADI